MLTLQFIPYTEIEELSPARRVHKLLEVVKENKIVLLEGRLRREEEADLIQITMEHITPKFKGIEIAVINPEQKSDNLLRKLKLNMMSFVLGDRMGMTIIGPATIVREIKRNPEKIELYTVDEKRKRK
ncbi:MAG: DUF2073 domain-containing protein [Nanoarchaeota archaeon]|nr:DUF2073 domain-containing protein [Nanoarchaeota archaeon]